jgi:imidazolonepropionase-like amidohydrolase
MTASLLALLSLAAAPGENSPATYAQRLKTESTVIQAAEVHVGDGTVYKPGVIVLLDGKVAAVGQSPPLPSAARVIDLGSSVVTAGLVDAACQLGTYRREGFSEQSSEVIPQLDAAECIDYFSRDFEQLVKDGVTTVYVTGEAASVVSCRGAAVKTGGPVSERLLPATPCVKVTLSSESEQRGSFNSSPSRFGDVTFNARRPTTRMGSAFVFRDAFHDALRVKQGGKADDDPDALRALGEVLDGKLKLRFQAREAMDIRSAQRDCDEFGLTFTLEYGSEVGECLDLVTEHKIPVIFGPARDGDSRVAQRYDDAVTAWRTPRLLAEKGVTFCLTAADGSGERGLARQAGFAIRNGLDRARALRAVTSDAAAMIGLEKRVGKLAEGFDADLVAWNGAPFDDTSKPVLVVINGRPVFDPDGRFRKETP